MILIIFAMYNLVEMIFMEQYKNNKWVISYILLLIFCFWQASSLLKIEKGEALMYWIAFSSFVFYLLLLQINVKLYKASLIFSFLIILIIYPTLALYGAVTQSFIASLLYTNQGEATSYLNAIPLSVYLNLLGVLLMVILLIKLPYKRVSSSYFTVGIAFYLLFFPTLRFIQEGKNAIILNRYNRVSIVKVPILVGYLSYLVKKDFAEIERDSKLPDKWEILNKDSLLLKDNFIIVIGESVRKDFLQSYGFPINNTPFMDSSARIQFDNYLSVGSHTVPSLMRTLVNSSEFPKFSLSDNIVKLSNKMGFETYWVTNQGFIGFYDTPISKMAMASKHTDVLNGGGYQLSKRMDAMMLPMIDSILAQKTAKPKMVFINMMGSHPFISDRTGGVYDQFILSEDFSNYVQSIKILDDFMSHLYTSLQHTEKSFQLIYLSDHGQYIFPDYHIRHAEGYKQLYDVPLIVWGDDITDVKRIKAYRNGRDFLKLFSELTNLKTSSISDDFQFISEENRDEKSFMVLGANSEIIDYRKLIDNPIPKFQVKK